MTNKKTTSISLISLLLAAIGGWQLAMFSAQASGETRWDDIPGLAGSHCSGRS